jgi:uncharacterized protein YdbL (DUF1318 family)
VVGTTTNAVNTNGWTRLEFHAIQNATTGTLELRLYKNPDAAVGSYTEQLSFTNQNSGSSAYATYGFGQSASRVNMAAFWMDDVKVSSTGWVGPAANTYSVSLSTSSTSVASIQKQVAKTLNASSTSVAAIQKQVAKTLNASSASVASITVQSIVITTHVLLALSPRFLVLALWNRTLILELAARGLILSVHDRVLDLKLTVRNLLLTLLKRK